MLRPSPPRVAVIRRVLEVDRIPSAIQFDVQCLEPVVALIGYRQHLHRGVVISFFLALLPAVRFRIQIFRMSSLRDLAFFRRKALFAEPLPRRVRPAAEATQPVFEFVPGLPAKVLPAASAAQPGLPPIIHLYVFRTWFFIK